MPARTTVEDQRATAIRFVLILAWHWTVLPATLAAIDWLLGYGARVNGGLQRNLLYTAITRDRKLVVLVGTPRAVGLATRRADARQRYTALCSRLQARAGASARS